MASLPAILTSKEQAYFPCLLAQIQFENGSFGYFSTHNFNTAEGGNQYQSNSYLARLNNQTISTIQARSSQGVDSISDVTLEFDNADQYILLTYEMAAGMGFKGAIVKLALIMCDITNLGVYIFNNDSVTPFKFTGVCDAPARSPMGASTMAVRATTSHNMAMVNFPIELCETRCVNLFPINAARRLAGATDQSAYEWGCGYNPDQAGTDPEIGGDCRRGNTTTPNATDSFGNVIADGSGNYIVCDYTKTGCVARGMYSTDSSARATGRFKGVQWAPSWREGQSKSYVQGKNVTVFAFLNQGIYGKPYPLVYGTQWVNSPLIANTIGDGNSTRMEIVVANGDIGQNGVQMLVINGIIIPAWSTQGVDKLERWNFLDNLNSPQISAHTGSRNGYASQDAEYNGQGDPYGGLATIEAVVYSDLAQSNSTASVQALINGTRIAKYAPIATYNNGLITFPTGVPNVDVAGNAPFTIQVLQNSLSAANGTWGLSSWSYGPPGTVTLASGPSGTGTGGWIRYLSYGQIAGITSPAGNTYTSFGQNPAWAVFDILIWANYSYAELDITSFYNAAVICDQPVTYTDLNGNSATHPRYIFQYCFEELTRANEVIASALRSFNGQLVDNSDSGLKQLFIRQTLADQQPAALPGSNYNTAISSIHADGTSGNGFVAYLIDEGVVLQDENGNPQMEGPSCAPNAQAPNYIQFQFQDADNQWVSDSLSVVDPEDVARSSGYLLGGSQIPANYPIRGVSSFDQGHRIANAILAENYRGNTNRDTRGTYTWTPTTTQRLEHLRAGQICLLRFQSQQLSPLVALQSPPGTPITGVLVRVEAINPKMDYKRMTVTLKMHEDYWYTTTYGQTAVPPYSDPTKSVTGRPPLPWRPYAEQPISGDSMFSTTEWGFSVSQFYGQAADGSPIAQLLISGCSPVNQFSPTLQPPQVGVQGTTANTGGTIPGGQTITGAIAVQDSNGLWSPLSKFFSVYIPTGTNTNTFISPPVAWPAGMAHWTLFAGLGHNKLCEQATGSTTPATVAFTSLNVSTYGPPDPIADSLQFEVKPEVHGGVWGDACSVDATSNGDGTGFLTFSVACTTHQFQQVDATHGYDLSVLALPIANQLNVPIADFHVIDNTGAVYHVSPDPSLVVINGVTGVKAGTVFKLNYFPTTITAITIKDPNTVNAYDPSGFGGTGNELVGTRLRITKGTGRGQERNIVGNNADTITIDKAWHTTPDNTSRYIIETAAWQDLPYSTISNTALVPSPIPNVGSIDIQNYSQEVVLIRALVLDQNGNSSVKRWSPIREAYVWGSGAARTITTSQTMLSTDRFPRFDTSGITRPTATTLNGALNNSQTNVTLTAATSQPNGTYIGIDTGGNYEAMLMTAGSGTASITVVRGQLGTTAVSHLTLVAVVIPGALTYTLLPASQVPNSVLYATRLKTTVGGVLDINYVVILPGGSDVLPLASDGSTPTSIILRDSTTANGTSVIKFPAN
jgi:hypothetical protein